MEVIEKLIYYVYLLLNPLKPGKFVYTINEKLIELDFEPFYAGKGKGRRIKQHFFKCIYEEKNTHIYHTIKQIINSGEEPITIKLFESLNSNDSINLEILTIKTIGRKDLGEGPLNNHTNGGEGVPGVKRSKEYIEKSIKRNKELGLKKTLWFIIDGYFCVGLNDTAKYLGISTPALVFRLKSDVYSTYKYATKEEINEKIRLGEYNYTTKLKPPIKATVMSHEEQMNRMHQAHREAIVGEETRLKMRLAKLGKKQSREHAEYSASCREQFVVVNNKIYKGVQKTRKAFGITRMTFHRRLHDGKDPNIRFATHEEIEQYNSNQKEINQWTTQP